MVPNLALFSVSVQKKTNQEKQNTYLVNLGMLEKFDHGYIFRGMINGGDINDIRYLL